MFAAILGCSGSNQAGDSPGRNDHPHGDDEEEYDHHDDEVEKEEEVEGDVMIQS